MAIGISATGPEMIIVGLVLVLLGYLIRFQKRLELIAGFDPSKVDDSDALANLVGGVALLIGMVTALVGVLMRQTTLIGNEVLLAYTLGVLLIFVGTVIRARKF